MDIKRVFSVFFSPCGNVKVIANAVACALGDEFGGIKPQVIDFTLPGAREGKYDFEQGDVVVFGTPVFAGRVPNKILPYVQEGFSGNGAIAISMVAFGNRNFDNGLSELTGELKNNGFIIAGGAAVPTQHSFTDKMAPGRPDKADLDALASFGKEKAALIKAANSPSDIKSPEVPGEYPPPAYYTPLQKDGTPAKFLKAVPLTLEDKCVSCGLCSKSCPMGSIDPGDNKTITGICIKCHACVNKCPKKAKYFDDPALASHIEMLVENYSSNKWELTLS